MRTVVAPVFEHGAGRADVGGICMAQNVFLPEDEAMAVIAEELGKQGVRLAERNVEWADVKIPRRMERIVDRNHPSRVVIEEMSLATPSRLKVDGVDPKKNVAVEFVGQSELEYNGAPMPSCTAYTQNFKEVAQYLSRQIQKNGSHRVYFGTFYDPAAALPDRQKYWERTKHLTAEERRREDDRQIQKAREQSIHLLRLQVQEFVEWLKAQGVI